VTTDAELVRVWREGLQETARRCRAWPAEVRHDAAMESFLAFLEAARRGEQVHKAAPYWVGRKAFGYLTRPRHSGRGYHGRPIASAAMLGPGLGERVGPDEWLAESQAVVVDFDAAVGADPSRVLAEREAWALKVGRGAVFERALARLRETHGNTARDRVAETCGVSRAVVHQWAAGVRDVPPRRRAHLIAAMGLGPYPGPPPTRRTRTVARPAPIVLDATAPTGAVDHALVVDLLATARPATIAAVCAVHLSTAARWRTGERRPGPAQVRKILAAHTRGLLGVA
jgi:hypothetical protein